MVLNGTWVDGDEVKGLETESVVVKDMLLVVVLTSVVVCDVTEIEEVD